MLRCCVAVVAATTNSTIISSPPTRSRAVRRNVQSCSSAKKPPDELEGEGGVLSSRSVLLRSGAALFALGFVDAGYSGDWSRIGAISKKTEEMIKLGAYAVVPLCLAFILSASEDGDSKS